MSEKKPRRFQFHLNTCIVTLFSAGIWICLAMEFFSKAEALRPDVASTRETYHLFQRAIRYDALGAACLLGALFTLPLIWWGMEAFNRRHEPAPKDDAA